MVHADVGLSRALRGREPLRAVRARGPRDVDVGVLAVGTRGASLSLRAVLAVVDRERGHVPAAVHDLDGRGAANLRRGLDHGGPAVLTVGADVALGRGRRVVAVGRFHPQPLSLGHVGRHDGRVAGGVNGRAVAGAVLDFRDGDAPAVSALDEAPGVSRR